MTGKEGPEMRVAIFSDVHGNSIALDAVLADIDQAGGVDAHWFIGDAADLGFDPVGSVQRIMQLPGLRAVRGNADRESTTHAHDIDEDFATLASTDLKAAQTALTIQGNCFWTRGAVTAAGLFDWLAGLPVEERIALPDRTQVLLVHAAPGTDEGLGVRREHSDEDVGSLLAGVKADLVIVGHTHRPLDRTVDGVRFWNPGSISNPVTSDTRAMWTLLEAEANGYRLERRFAAYNVARMFTQLAGVHQPAESYIRGFWREKE